MAAAPKSMKIEATRSDPVYAAKRSINSIRAILSQAHAGDNDSCAASEPLSLFERNRLRTTSTTSLSISDGADEFLLDDATLFRTLQLVSLRSDLNNSNHLKSLATNYPNVQIITIRQASSLSDGTVRCLKQFNKLTNLELWCQINSSNELLDSLPESLQYLQIADSLPLPALPHLTELKVNKCLVDSKFLELLDTPSLERLSFSNVDLARGALQHLGRFKSLREISLYNSNLDASELQYVRALDYVSFHSYENKKHRTLCQGKAETFFKDKNFKEAADYYKECVFCTPTVYGYLQLARCYLELGDIRSASKNRDHAASIDPDSKDVAEFDAQIETRRRSQQSLAL
jgi:tetratricopeptide (TPR) repeat protein